MRLILLLSIFFLFLNCEDKQSKKKINPEKEITTIVKEEGLTGDEDTTDVVNRPFPKLNSKNAMEFFLQYDKVHKENKVCFG